MNTLADLKKWVQNSEIGDECVFTVPLTEEMPRDEVDRFSQYINSLNSKFIVWKLTTDARGYKFKRIENGDKLFNGDSDSRLDPHVKVSVFRPRYRKLTDDELKLMDEIKAQAQLLWDLFDKIDNSGRYTALAKTELESAVMWAVKDVTK